MRKILLLLATALMISCSPKPHKATKQDFAEKIKFDTLHSKLEPCQHY